MGRGSHDVAVDGEGEDVDGEDVAADILVSTGEPREDLLVVLEAGQDVPCGHELVGPAGGEGEAGSEGAAEHRADTGWR